MPVTTAARTLADLAALAGHRFLGRLVDDALRRRLTTLDELREAALGAGRRGCRSSVRPRSRQADFRRATVPRRSSSPASSLPASRAGPPAPGRAGGRVYLLDLAYPDRRVGIEYDGWDAHRTRSAFDGDRARGNDLALAGWTVLRFTSATPEHQIVAAVRFCSRLHRLTPAFPRAESRILTVVYTDGACLGNPGPGGWAWAVPGGRFESGASPATTNQRMEVQAALEAVTSLDGPLEVVSDSTYVVNCFRDRWWEGWIRRGWLNTAKKPVANRDLWEPLVEAVRADPGRVTFRWVKGHSNDVSNDLVDRLAVEAARTQTGRSGVGHAVAPRAGRRPGGRPSQRP